MSFVIAGVAVGAVGLGYSIYSGIQNQKAMAGEEAQQTNAENNELTQAQNQENNTSATNDANAQRNADEQKLSGMGLGKQGWAGTILTSPLGVDGGASTSSAPANAGSKTILGA